MIHASEVKKSLMSPSITCASASEKGEPGSSCTVKTASKEKNKKNKKKQKKTKRERMGKGTNFDDLVALFCVLEEQVCYGINVLFNAWTNGMS
jgi:hypothetical protein